MHSTAAGTPSFSTDAFAALTRKSTLSAGFYARCSLKMPPPPRSWVVMREGRAWFHTAACEGVKAAGSESQKEKSEDKTSSSVKVSRRRGGGAGTAPGLVGNPDLLTIPGVGPRNLRKLVDNGIGDVAELKQLYKDKVSFCPPLFFF